jgi:hypothetical protein
MTNKFTFFKSILFLNLKIVVIKTIVNKEIKLESIILRIIAYDLFKVIELYMP